MFFSTWHETVGNRYIIISYLKMKINMKNNKIITIIISSSPSSSLPDNTAPLQHTWSSGDFGPWADAIIFPNIDDCPPIPPPPPIPSSTQWTATVYSTPIEKIYLPSSEKTSWVIPNDRSIDWTAWR